MPDSQLAPDHPGSLSKVLSALSSSRISKVPSPLNKARETNVLPQLMNVEGTGCRSHLGMSQHQPMKQLRTAEVRLLL